jgi:hypothetical protein
MSLRDTSRFPEERTGSDAAANSGRQNRWRHTRIFENGWLVPGGESNPHVKVCK